MTFDDQSELQSVRVDKALEARLPSNLISRALPPNSNGGRPPGTANCTRVLNGESHSSTEPPFERQEESSSLETSFSSSDGSQLASLPSHPSSTSTHSRAFPYSRFRNYLPTTTIQHTSSLRTASPTCCFLFQAQ